MELEVWMMAAAALLVVAALGGNIYGKGKR
jgi:hypothetical protein